MEPLIKELKKLNEEIESVNLTLEAIIEDFGKLVKSELKECPNCSRWEDDHDPDCAGTN